MNGLGFGFVSILAPSLWKTKLDHYQVRSTLATGAS
jgi:hypothetical protein